MSAPSLGALGTLFLRIGVTAFGGPAAHIAMMHDELVRRRRWMDEQGFLDRLGITNLIPGPNSTELAILAGSALGRAPGLVIAGLAFIVPAVAIVLALSWVYVTYGETPAAESLLYGVKPVIIAIVVYALVSLARRALAGALPVVLFVAALAAYLAGVSEFVVLLASGVLAIAVRSTRGARLHALVGPALVAAPVWAQAARSEVDLERLFVLFLKVGAVLYGSGYVLLAFLRTELVDDLGWLTSEQLLDAVAIGQVTPGPLFSTATFAGYVVAGLPGAALATAGIFLPSFLFVAIIGPFAARLRESRPLSDALDGINAAALALMAGVTLQLGRTALVDAPTVAVAVVSALLLVRLRLNSAWLIAGGALLGLLAPTGP